MWFTTYVIGARNLPLVRVLILTGSVLCGKLLCSENRLRLNYFYSELVLFLLLYFCFEFWPTFIFTHSQTTMHCHVLITGVLCQRSLRIIVLLNPSTNLTDMHPFISEQAQHVNHHLAVLKLYILYSLSPDWDNLVGKMPTLQYEPLWKLQNGKYFKVAASRCLTL